MTTVFWGSNNLPWQWVPSGAPWEVVCSDAQGRVRSFVVSSSTTLTEVPPPPRYVPKRSGRRWYAMTPKRRVFLHGGPLDGWVFEAPASEEKEFLDWTIAATVGNHWKQACPEWVHSIRQVKYVVTDEWGLWFRTRVAMDGYEGHVYHIRSIDRIESRDHRWPELHYTYTGFQTYSSPYVQVFPPVRPEPPTTACDDCDAIFPAMEAYHSQRTAGRLICPACFTVAKTAGRAKERSP